jgi:type IV secretory pathway TraG/TraD family ATPase VirD4
MIRTFRWLAAVAAALVIAAPPAWVIAVTATIATTVVLAQATARIRHKLVAERDPPTGTVALGTDAARGGRVLLTDQQLSAHALILGATGAGKSTTLLTVLTEHVRSGRPVVAIDMKGSPAFAEVLADAAASAGRPFRLWTLDGPGRWNPLAYGNATELKDKLIASERFTEPHYQRAAERYLQNLFQVLRHLHPQRPPTLEEVVALMDTRRLPAALRGLPRPLADRVQDYLSGLSPDQQSAIRGLQTRLAIITESDSGPFLSGGDDAIDLRAALAGGDVVVFSLNSSRYPSFAAQLGTLAVQDVISATGSRLERIREGDHLEQATVAIDEFSAIGAVHVVALFARGREAGVSGLVVTQEMADLDRLGRGIRDQILGNTALKLILRQDVPESADLVAQIAGTEKVWEETRQIGGTIFRGFPAAGTRREAEQFVVHPNEIKSLRTGDAVLISKLRGDRAQTIKGAPPPRANARAPRRAGTRQSAAPDRGTRAERGGRELG